MTTLCLAALLALIVLALLISALGRLLSPEDEEEDEWRGI